MGIPVNNGCGLICKVFKTLEGQLGVMQDEIDGLKTELHNKEIKEGDYDNHTVTYDEKVLPDGSVLRINKTTIHDTDDNGNVSSSNHRFIMCFKKMTKTMNKKII